MSLRDPSVSEIAVSPVFFRPEPAVSVKFQDVESAAATEVYPGVTAMFPLDPTGVLTPLNSVELFP